MAREFEMETYQALRTLRVFTRDQVPVGPDEVRDAINTLDNAGVFREVDEASNYQASLPGLGE